MAKWTEEDIRIFWEMKRDGESLVSIADRLGRNYTAIANYASKQKKKAIPKEDTKMEVETNNIMPEESTVEANTPIVTPKTPAAKNKNTICQALDMIESQGLEFHDMDISLSRNGASMVLHFTLECNHE